MTLAIVWHLFDTLKKARNQVAIMARDKPLETVGDLASGIYVKGKYAREEGHVHSPLLKKTQR